MVAPTTKSAHASRKPALLHEPDVSYPGLFGVGEVARPEGAQLIRILGLLLAVLLAAVVIAIAPAALASAHSDLHTSSPAKGATVEPPERVALTFGDTVQKNLAEIAVVNDATGERADNGKPNLTSPKGLTVAVADMEPGAYTVTWAALAADGHRMTGTFGFNVAAASGATTTTTMAPVAPSQATTKTQATAMPKTDKQPETAKQPQVIQTTAAAQTTEPDNRNLKLAACAAVALASLAVLFFTLKPRY